MLEYPKSHPRVASWRMVSQNQGNNRLFTCYKTSNPTPAYRACNAIYCVVPIPLGFLARLLFKRKQCLHMLCLNPQILLNQRYRHM